MEEREDEKEEDDNVAVEAEEVARRQRSTETNGAWSAKKFWGSPLTAKSSAPHRLGGASGRAGLQRPAHGRRPCLIEERLTASIPESPAGRGPMSATMPANFSARATAVPSSTRSPMAVMRLYILLSNILSVRNSRTSF